MIEFVKFQVLPSRPAQLIIRTIHEWQRDECLEMGAALAYYALFSMFPIFLVVLSIMGWVLGSDAALIQDILAYANQILPDAAYSVFRDVLFHLDNSSVGAGITGFFLLLLAASNVFGALSRSVDKIWKVHYLKTQPKPIQDTLLLFLKEKFFAFSLVFSSSAIMVVSLVAELAFDILRRLLKEFNSYINFIQLDEVTVIRNVQIFVTFLVLILIVMVLFKILPSTRVRWGDIWIGALFTTVLFMLLQYLVSNSVIHIGAQYRSYGIIGGVMVLMLWIYLTCQIFFLGSEFCYVYSHLYGSRRHLRDDATVLRVRRS
ncbi:MULTISPECIES: YihY/virulence factor BrkB family protein [unclassified Leptolyngbya]|uniref:YhjD/YihY/BrkB family envelope integrity protein n=1 Tax=unclassified Leptolyngbya TaxID=2650499 RepID=UPI001685F642|nr:YihY/virulence factor BrkB family protein [Leptolyngbya sp. FACHB-8]MBD2156421.1 YihY/virulence factor BrkB family protein [Leptolyngbya sp. FACHB-16]